MAFTTPCVAESYSIHKVPPSEKAEQLFKSLKAMGISNPHFYEFASKIDARIDNGRLKLAEQEVPGGKIALQYRLTGGLSSKQAELRFTPEGLPNTELTATIREVRVSYHFQF